LTSAQASVSALRRERSTAAIASLRLFAGFIDSS
jgi:hypothetical protein